MCLNRTIAHLRIGMTAQICEKLEYIKKRYAWTVFYVGTVVELIQESFRQVHLLSAVKKLARSQGGC